MKKSVLFASMIAVVSVFFLWQLLLLRENNITNAQTSDIERQKLMERDKNVPKEKVEKAFAEAKKIQDEILAVVAKEMPEFKLQRASAQHLKSGNSLEYNATPGRRGATYNEISWQNKETRVFLNFHLGFNKEDTSSRLHTSMSGISMGEFFDVPDIGDEATLVKNVTYNKKATSVSLHFVKGRAAVSIYLKNLRRKTAKNEKELMEIVRLIEPLIVAKPNFDDQ